ncbi:transposase [Halapricum salinum]|mgnify:CR=1 FL=1|uniref:transposase n=1 Tax=Halapricum salinum TaxID=1457250 RepID=UPI001F235A21|nr:transposase [Halapricum salinum]
MTDLVVRTVVARFVEPTAHKQRKIEALRDTYREALHEAFEHNATTMSAVNDIVTPYELPYQAKDALKSFVPTLYRGTKAQELNENHPVRFVNRAATFDRSSDRTHEFCWRVPQAGRGNAFWIPLQINPTQYEHWESLCEDPKSAGELRLLQRQDRWELHVDIKYVSAVSPETDPTTVLGFDVGESALVTGCVLCNGIPTQPLLVDGSRAKRLRKERETTIRRLKRRNAPRKRLREQYTSFANAIEDIIEKSSRQAIEYASHFEDPLIVMEELTHMRDDIDYGAYMNRRLHGWAFARLQRRIEQKAVDAGMPVTYVRPEYTSQICHSCFHLGSRPSQAMFECRNEECHITTFQADINAAANIARRADPWGESCPWKPDQHRRTGDC